MTKNTVFPFALLGIMLAVGLVAIVAISGPLGMRVAHTEENTVGHPFATGDEYDVTLVSPEPVYTYTDAHFPPPAGYIPWRVFETITYLPGTGQFAVGGICNIGGGRQAQYAHKFGMYLIRDTGELAGTRDACIDTSTARAGDWCGAETHRCTKIGTRIMALAGGRFLRENAMTFNDERPAAVYGTSGGSMEMYARHPLIDMETAPPGTLGGFANIAVANGRAIGISHLPDHSLKNTIYSLPDLQLVTSFDKEYTPIVGVGEYFIGWKVLGSGVNTWEYSVYRMPASGTAKPTFISTFSGKQILGSGIVDSTNPNRVGLLFKDKVSSALEFVIYNAGVNGLIEESRRPVPQRWMGTMSAPQSAMAGEYLVYGRCPSTSQLFEDRAESCRVFVEKNGVDVVVEQLPRDGNGRRRVVTAAAISDTGRILLSTTGYISLDPSAIARMYLYDINEFSSNPSPPGDGGDDNEGGDGLPPPPIPPVLGCIVDSDCAQGSCVAGACSNTPQSSSASFTAESATCTTGFPKIFCTARITWESSGTGVIQLVQEDGKTRACSPAGAIASKNLVATSQPRTYYLAAAVDCDSAPSRMLDTMTVQAVST